MCGNTRLKACLSQSFFASMGHWSQLFCDRRASAFSASWGKLNPCQAMQCIKSRKLQEFTRKNFSFHSWNPRDSTKIPAVWCLNEVLQERQIKVGMLCKWGQIVPALHKEQPVSTHIRPALLDRYGNRGKRGYGTVYSFLLTSIWLLVETVDHIWSNLSLIGNRQWCFAWELDGLVGKWRYPNPHYPPKHNMLSDYTAVHLNSNNMIGNNRIVAFH